MKEYPGNPATNKLAAGVTDEDVLKAIQASGYTLQSVAVDRIMDSAMNVLNNSGIEGEQLAKYRLKCQEEWPYIDGDSGSTHTLDALIGIDITDESSRKPRA